MTKSEDKDSVFRWLKRPLCCKYTAVVFRTALIGHDEAERGPCLAAWGLGRLADSDSEILGVWMPQGRALHVPHQVFMDLSERGVESFQVLAGCSVTEEASATLGDFLGFGDNGVQVIAKQGRSLRQSDAVRLLRPATRRAVLAADELVDGIHQRLHVALARRGPFPGEAEAMAFVAEFLARAESRLHEPPAPRGSRSFGRIGPASIAAHP